MLQGTRPVLTRPFSPLSSTGPQSRASRTRSSLISFTSSASSERDTMTSFIRVRMLSSAPSIMTPLAVWNSALKSFAGMGTSLSSSGARHLSTLDTGVNKRAILFPGQGSQYVGMGKDLYDAYPVARQVVDEADDALGGTLRHVMFEGSQEELTKTENAQPAILTTSIAFLRVLESECGFNLEGSCQYALGHSLGEYSALVASKALNLHDAVKLVRLRGEAMTKAVTDKGTTAMSALVVRPAKLPDLMQAMEEIKTGLPRSELAEIANINSSFQVVISGTVKGVDHASRVLQARKIAARAVDLPVSAPFHCALMQPAAETMKGALEVVKFSKPVINIISNVTARPIEKVDDIRDLLVRQVTGTVLWSQSISHLRQECGVNEYISLGPGKVLANLLRKEFPTDSVTTVTTVDDIRQWSL